MEDKDKIYVYNTEDIEPNYSILLSMFPKVHAQYIREICIKPPFTTIEGDLLVMLINHLLSYENNLDPESVSQLLIAENNSTLENESDKQLCEALQKEQNINEKVQIIVNIIPDCNPEIIKQYVIEHYNDEQSLEEFVQSKLINKDYVKRNEYYIKKKKEEKVKQYITNFNVEEFLELFPEPFDHFENFERQCLQDKDALTYLENKYKHVEVLYIRNLYSNNKFNLSITDKFLGQQFGNQFKVELNIQFDNIPLLQEIAFIENKSIIKEHIDMITAKKEKEVKMLRLQNLLLTCQCCFDECTLVDNVECGNGHIFCIQCIIKGTKMAISRAEGSVHCFENCNNEFQLNVLKQVLPKTIYDAFLMKRQEIEIMNAKLDNLTTCPFCPFSMEIAPEIQIFNCQNQECMKITCRLCKKLNHAPVKCADVLDEHKSRIMIEEELSKVVIRYCPDCNVPIIKTYGCNKMVCSQCKSCFCYICKQKIQKGYSHFEGLGNCKTHENSDSYDQYQLHIKLAETKTKILKDYPDLKIPKI